MPRKLDADRTMTLLSPRRAGSAWSGINKRHIADLEKQNLLEEPGIRAIERAKSDGSWAFLDEVERLEKPDDLVMAFQTLPKARAAYDKFPPSAQRGNLEWIKQAKSGSTRAKRIAATVEAARNGTRVA